MLALQKYANWPSFGIALSVYIVSVGVTSRTHVPLASRGFVYSSGSITESLAQSSIASTLYLLFAIPETAAFAYLFLCGLTAMLSLVKVPEVAKNVLIAPAVFGAAGVAELVFLTLSYFISTSFVFVMPAVLLNLVKNLASSAQFIALAMFLPAAAKEWATSIGREGRQRIKKSE